MDDNPHDLTRLEYQLGSISSKHQLHAVTDPIEAVMRLRSDDFGMLFANYRMSVMDGLSLARIANKVAPELSVNILASQADAVYVKSQVTYANCSNLILKPCDINELQHVLEQYNRFQQLSQENDRLSARLAALEKHSSLHLSQAGLH